MLWDLEGSHSKQGYFHPTLFLCQLTTCYKKVQRTTIWTLVMGTFISSQPPHNHQFNNIMIDPLHHPYLPCYVVFALWDTTKIGQLYFITLNTQVHHCCLCNVTSEHYWMCHPRNPLTLSILGRIWWQWAWECSDGMPWSLWGKGMQWRPWGQEAKPATVTNYTLWIQVWGHGGSKFGVPKLRYVVPWFASEGW